MSAPAIRPELGLRSSLTLAVIGSLIVALVVLAFTWPGKTTETRHLPIALAGPQEQVEAVKSVLEQNTGDVFDIVTANDRTAAIESIEQRDTYGAIVFSESVAPEVLTASASNTAATQIVTNLGQQLQAMIAQQLASVGQDASGFQFTSTDIVPLTPNDPQGSGIASAAFPMMLSGIIGGAALSILVRSVRNRFIAAVALSAVAGVLVTLILKTWFQFLPASFAVNALAIGISILATSSLIIGFERVLGKAGIAAGVVITLLIANPLSSAASPRQFLPRPWGWIGQFFVPGASNSLLRAVNYFPHADISMQWLVLAAWILVGLVLVGIGALVRRPRVQTIEEILAEELITAEVVSDSVPEDAASNEEPNVADEHAVDAPQDTDPRVAALETAETTKTL